MSARLEARVFKKTSNVPIVMIANDIPRRVSGEERSLSGEINANQVPLKARSVYAILLPEILS